MSSQTLPSWARIPLHRPAAAVSVASTSPTAVGTSSSANLPRMLSRTPMPDSPSTDASASPSLHPHRFDLPVGSRDTLFLQEQHALALQSMHKEIESLRAENRELKFKLVMLQSAKPEAPGAEEGEKHVDNLLLQIKQLRRTVEKLMLENQLLARDPQPPEAAPRGRNFGRAASSSHLTSTSPRSTSFLPHISASSGRSSPRAVPFASGSLRRGALPTL